MELVTVKSKMDKTMRTAYEAYKNAEHSELWQVYGKYSDEKENAHKYCMWLMKQLGGWRGRIISANTFIFTFGFEFINPETGAVSFAYITPTYDRFAEV